MALPKANAGLIGRSATLEAEYETTEGEILKEGTVVEIREIDRSGVTIQTATCPTCGRRIAVSGISRSDLTLVKQSDIHAAAISAKQTRNRTQTVFAAREGCQRQES